MTTRRIAASAVMVALLIAMQYVLQFVVGVELVSVLLLCFCYTFGVWCGLMTATAFSILRCLLFGFSPNVVVLYLVYYNLFALVFGIAARRRPPVWLCPVLLAILAALCCYFAAAGVPVSILYRKKLSAMLWVLFGIITAILIFYIALIVFKKSGGRELATVTALAAFMTVCMTLLDDIVTPLFLGYSADAALAYFYTGFLAMLPQTICVSLSVLLLFYPLKAAFGYIAKPRKTI